MTYFRHPLQRVFGCLGLPLTPGSSSASSPYPFCISVAWLWYDPSCKRQEQQQCEEYICSYHVVILWVYIFMFTAKSMNKVVFGICEQLLIRNKYPHVFFLYIHVNFYYTDASLNNMTNNNYAKDWYVIFYDNLYLVPLPFWAQHIMKYKSFVLPGFAFL